MSAPKKSGKKQAAPMYDDIIDPPVKAGMSSALRVLVVVAIVLMAVISVTFVAVAFVLNRVGWLLARPSKVAFKLEKAATWLSQCSSDVADRLASKKAGITLAAYHQQRAIEAQLEDAKKAAARVAKAEAKAAEKAEAGTNGTEASAPAPAQ